MRMTMLTFPENSFPSPLLAIPWFAFMLEQTSSVLALCEVFLHFLSEPSITGHGLCEEFPKILFGESPAAGSAEKSLFMRKLGDHVRTPKHGVLCRFEGKIQKMRVSTGRLFEQVAHDKGTIFAKKQTTFGVELKMGTGVVLYPKRRMGSGRGPGIRFVKGFSGFSAEKKRRNNLCTTI